MKRILLWSVILLTSTTIGLLYYFGFFVSIEVHKGPQGGYLLGGYYHTGSYEKMGPTFEKTKRSAEALGFPTDTLIAFYLNDPDKVPEDSLLSFVGAIIHSGDIHLAGNVEHGDLEIMPIFKGPALYVDFPYKNAFSSMIGAMRVYPFLTKEAEKRGFEAGQVYEIYSENRIRYVFQAYPVANEMQDAVMEQWVNDPAHRE